MPRDEHQIALSEADLKTIHGCLRRVKARFENKLEDVTEEEGRELAHREIRRLEELRQRIEALLVVDAA